MWRSLKYIFRAGSACEFTIIHDRVSYGDMATLDTHLYLMTMSHQIVALLVMAARKFVP